MKTQTLATLFSLTATAYAHGPDLFAHAAIHRRQEAPAPAPTDAAATPSQSGPFATLSVSGENPYSIPPVASIVPTMETSSMSASTTYSAGASPTYLSNAPPLPTQFVFSQADWPALDKQPPIDSPEVKEWMKELEGWDIPDLGVTQSGECATDPEFAADAEKRGWWTCGGYTRDTDIVECPDKDTWGVSFDDGPGPKTPLLLEYLADKDVKSTFFVVGSRVISSPNILIEEYMAGHEISIHTWAHPSLTTLTNEQIVAELGWTRKAIKEVLGVTPTTMRPPYGDIDDRVRAISLAMGLVPIMWTRTKEGVSFDTFDWKIGGGEVTADQSIEQFNNILGNATTIDTGFIVLQHDLYVQTVDMAVGYTMDLALNHKDPSFKLQAIGSCAGKPITDMYRETNTNSSFPFSNSTDTSVSGNGTSDANSGHLGENGGGDGALGIVASAPLSVMLALAGAASLFTLL